MFDQKCLKKTLALTTNTWTKVLLRIQTCLPVSSPILLNKSLALNPKCLNKSLCFDTKMLEQKSWLQIQHVWTISWFKSKIFDLKLCCEYKCMTKCFASNQKCLNKSLASKPKCFNKVLLRKFLSNNGFIHRIQSLQWDKFFVLLQHPQVVQKKVPF